MVRHGQHMRQVSPRSVGDGVNGRRRRIIRVRRPQISQHHTRENDEKDDNDVPTLIGMRTSTTSPTSVDTLNYEDAIKAAAAIVYANDNTTTNNTNNIDQIENANYSNSTNDTTESITNTNLISDDSSSSTESDDDKIDRNSNRFEILLEDASSSSSESSSSSSAEEGRILTFTRRVKIVHETDSSSEEGSTDSNPFNVLMDSSSCSSPFASFDSPYSTTSEECSDGGSSPWSLTDSEGEDDGIAKCAVCFLKHDPLNTWRSLVVLPCCGGDGKEESSSTRFCSACLLKIATTKHSPEVSNEYSPDDEERYDSLVAQFYDNDCQTDTTKLLECPRCRDILRVNIEKIDSDYDDDSSCDCSVCRPSGRDWTNPENIQSITLQIPSFEERVRYVGKKMGTARILWRASFLHHGFMPMQALRSGGNESDVRKLASNWGILRKVAGKGAEIFSMERDSHKELIKILGLEHVQFNGEVFGKDDALALQLALGMGHAIYSHTCEFRIDRTLRLLNRFSFLLLLFKGYLPPYPLNKCQELVVTGLNIFLLTMLLQFVCISAVYIVSFFGVGVSICYLLRQSGDRSSWVIPLVSYLAYRLLNELVFSSTFVNWFNLVVPKAAIGIKKIIWG